MDEKKSHSYWKLYHLSSKDHEKGHIPIAKDSAEWPAEWSQKYYKEYPRSSKLKLPVVTLDGDLGQSIAGRRSRRAFTGIPLSLEDLSALLKYSCGHADELSEEKDLFSQPSGGGLYPLQMYPIIFKGTSELPSGLYHFDTRSHSLDVLWKREFTEKDIRKLFNYEWVGDSSAAIVITCTFKQSIQKYGERAYRYSLLEAGHVGQSMYLVSEARRINCCAMGGTKDSAIEELIDIDGEHESLVYCLIFGR